MADYWKSQEKKYCDFCKCWITDNRPSVDFHEKGRRHQENVKKKLRTLTRNSAKEQKRSDNADFVIKQMEAAAMASYRKDVDNNADMTSIAINKKVQSENLAIASTSRKLWHEVATRDGKNYYKNILTNETVWTPPKEGYLSLKDQRDLRDAETAKQLREMDKFRRTEALITMQRVKQEEEEARARLAREKLKERRVQDDFLLQPVSCGPIIEPGKTDPYGKWQTVKESVPVDLQLPEQSQYYYDVPVISEPEPEPEVKEFKEKTVTRLEDDSDDEVKKEETGFKKRKLGGAAKRNTRQRLDND